MYYLRIARLTCFHASFFPFCPLCWPPLFLPFSRHIFALFSPSKTALFCRAKGTAQSLERGSSGMDLSTKFGKEIPSQNLRKKRSVAVPLWLPPLAPTDFKRESLHGNLRHPLMILLAHCQTVARRCSSWTPGLSRVMLSWWSA